MPTLSIENVPESVVEQLRQQARRHHRALQDELMALLHEALAASGDLPAQERKPASKTLDEIAALHRTRWPEPFPQAPRTVEIVRADRDAR